MVLGRAGATKGKGGKDKAVKGGGKGKAPWQQDWTMCKSCNTWCRSEEWYKWEWYSSCGSAFKRPKEYKDGASSSSTDKSDSKKLAVALRDIARSIGGLCISDASDASKQRAEVANALAPAPVEDTSSAAARQRRQEARTRQ